MKNLALLILSVGVAVCASFGARLSPNMRTELSVQGKASLAAGAERSAKAAYCKARTVAKLGFNAHCPDPDAKPEEAKAKAPAKAETVKKAEPTREALIAENRARVDGLKTTSETLTGEVLTARKAWIAAAETTVTPAADLKVLKPTAPGVRLKAWFSESGMPFLAGLFLVILGAIMGRKAMKADAMSGPKKGQAPVDFGQLLGTLRADVDALVVQMDGVEAPGAADKEAIKVAVEALQLEKFAPLVEARVKLQVRYGLGGYAEVFGPFSGGERRVNRVWSALVDNHWPEAHSSIRVAAEQLKQADEAMQALIAAQA
jgi:hypothetical protein